MKKVLISTAFAVMAGTFALADAASAQPGRYYDRGYNGPNDRYDRRDDRRNPPPPPHGWRERSDWRRGGYVSYNDWHRGYAVDYRRYHLRQPPRGYEWRRVNDNYILAALASGLIASVIVGGH